MMFVCVCLSVHFSSYFLYFGFSTHYAKTEGGYGLVSSIGMCLCAGGMCLSTPSGCGGHVFP